LAPGCARISIQNFERLFSPNSIEEVAVLGAGYMGLFTAKMLSERGYKTVVYADNYPFQKPRGPCSLASEAAGVAT
jgi:threonine dehydrogenase-like Zn-dependent dehydrogenase